MPSKQPRVPSKCREWEKERRNRLNEAFTTLSKLLPSYDPSVNTSKVDILKNAAGYIEELQTKIKGLIAQENDSDAGKKIKDDEYKKLCERIKRLLGKNEQLCGLLREAHISIPPGCAVIKKFKAPKLWSNKIPEQEKLEKENDASLEKPRKFPPKKQNKITPKHRKAILNRSESKKLKPVRKKKAKAPSKCVIVLSQPTVTQPCYVITNAPSNNVLGGTSTIITNSGLVANPLVSSKPAKTVSSVPPLGPGTLILANGTIMPVLPQQTVLPLAPQIITRPPIILVRKNNPVTVSTVSTTSKTVTTGVKTMARIKPKFCLTKTTQVNKVPIPALTSRYSNPEVVLKKAEPKPVKAKTVEKAEKEASKEVGEGGEKRKIAPSESENEAKKAKVDEKEKPLEAVKDKAESEKVPDLEKVTTETEKSTEEKSAKVSETEAKKPEETLDLNINHSELSNDIFATLQVPAGCQNPESTSPTAAFLLAFPLVSSGVKVTEVTEEDNADSQRETPTLLQIGTMDSTKPTQSETLTPSLLNLDNLSFFSSKDISGFYNSFESSLATTSTTSVVSTGSTVSKVLEKEQLQEKKTNYQVLQQQQSIQKGQQQPQKQPQQQHHSQKTHAQGHQQQQPHHQQQHSHQQQQQKPQQKSHQQQHLQQQQKTLQHPHQQQSTQLQNQQLMQPQQLVPQQQSQLVQEKNLVPCFDNHSIPNFGTSTNAISYQKGTNLDGSYNQKGFPCNFSEPKITTTYANTIKSYPEPLYTNSSTYTYSNTSDANFNQNYYKDISKTDNRSYYSLNYENYADYRKNDSNNYFPTSNYYSNTNYKAGNAQKKGTTQSRPPINWMTTPDNRLQTPSDYVLPQFTKEADFYPANSFTNTQTTYFNANPYPNEAPQEARKSLDLSLVPPVNSYQRNDVEDNQFSWSPTKIPQFLDPPHSFVSSTLPTLVGDLALGNPLPFGEQKGDKCLKKDSRRLKTYEGNQSNFLSVSQLVDHNKEVPARTTARRNSGNRTSVKKVQQKSSQRKDKVEGKMKQLYEFCDSKNRNLSKNSYSAEALIGHQMQDANQKRQNYPNKTISVSSFLHDNILPYFPTVDLPQDNTYMQQNQNYQSSSFGHNFPSTFQNNTYTANTLIPSTTITSSYNFMHEVPHDYSDNLNLFPQMSKDKTCPKPVNRNVREQCSTTPKKPKRKHSNDLPGFDFPFLSMPGSINSPILPDDFHTGFLQPTPQLYPCKNPFTKSNDLGSGSLLPLPPVPTRSNVQPEISPSNNAGTSLTNFNLSTIFPEMNNKNVVAEQYPESRVKELPRSYAASTVQVSFNDKPTFSFSYINCTTSQPYNQ